MTIPASVSLTFTAHNVVLPGGAQTLPGTKPVAESGTARAVLRDLELAFPGVAQGSVRVADLGCLEGGHSAAMAAAGYDVTGFEARPENILCCRYIEERLDLPNLKFIQADVREATAGADRWDAVLCCGLLYHLDNPVTFLHQLGCVTRRLLILQTHYSTRPDAENEGRRGHWYTENGGRWASWGNDRSFWLVRRELLDVIRKAGFDLVFEQHDYLDSIQAGHPVAPGLDERGMFTGLKTRPPSMPPQSALPGTEL